MPSVQKKINELEVGLLHLQQNIDIPEITLNVHPLIVAAVKRVTDDGRKPKVEDLEAAVSDSSFLNAIQKDVSRWVREIQKVCVHTVNVYWHSPGPRFALYLGHILIFYHSCF